MKITTIYLIAAILCFLSVSLAHADEAKRECRLACAEEGPLAGQWLDVGDCGESEQAYCDPAACHPNCASPGAECRSQCTLLSTNEFQWSEGTND